MQRKAFRLVQVIGCRVQIGCHNEGFVFVNITVPIEAKKDHNRNGTIWYTLVRIGEIHESK